jgi:hypothetical protein
MPHLEPTYLRYIYDGLLKGSIHPENAAELPEGLIGLYEEAFDERTSVVERQKLLERFAIWALLKKEVSVAFVAEVLGETEDEIQDFISTYSAWFNSPESGKYQLYHERLKVYLLQKISEKEIHELHEKLILRLELAIEEQKADKFEWYGLEFMTGHYAANAMFNGDGSKLLAIAYDQNHWQRQLKISKGYSWTNNGLKEVMTWASKYNDDEVIECALQLVDLHHQEQNAAPQIVGLVAEGDFDAALKRIEQFGGKDKEGLQRKFILYMLCMMELTLLDSKDKLFQKEGIEKLLKHLDDQLPVDYTVLNWGEFFSEHLIFKMACIAYNIGVGFDTIYKRVEFSSAMDVVRDERYFDWIDSSISYTRDDLIVLGEMIEKIAHYEKKDLINLWLVELAKHNQFKLINSVLRIVDSELKDEYFELIATTHASKRKIKKTIHYALKIKDATNKNLCLIRIINIFLERGNYVEAREILPLLTIRYYRVVSLCLFSNYIFKSRTGNHLNALNQAIKICETIQDDSWLIMAKRRIAATFITQRKFSKAIGIIGESFKIQTNREDINDFYLLELLQLLVEFRKFQFLNSIIDQIRNRGKKNLIIKNISMKLIESNKLELSSEIFQFINVEKEEYPGMFRWSIVLQLGAIELAKKGKIKLAVDLVSQIKNSSDKTDALLGIAQALFENKKQRAGLKITEKAFDEISSNGNAYDKGEVLKKIIYLLLNHSVFQNAMKYYQLITDDFWGGRDKINIEIANYFFRKELFHESIFYISKVLTIEKKFKAPSVLLDQKEISRINIKEIMPAFYTSLRKSEYSADLSKRNDIIKEIVSDYLKEGLYTQAKILAFQIQSKFLRCNSLIEVLSKDTSLNGNYFENTFSDIVKLAQTLDEEFEKCEVLSKLSNLRRKQGNIESADELLNESILLVKEMIEPWNFMALYKLYPLFFEMGKMKFIVNFTNRVIEDSFDDFGAKKDLVDQMTRFGYLKEAKNHSKELEDDLEKIEALIAISVELIVANEISEAHELIEEALKISRSLKNELKKSKALVLISSFYFKQAQDDEADLILEEGLTNIIFIENNTSDLFESIKVLSIEIAKQGNFEKAIPNAKKIKDQQIKDETLKSICLILAKDKKWNIAQEVSSNIFNNEVKFSLWERIGEKSINDYGLEESLLFLNQIVDENIKTYFLKGLTESIQVQACSIEFILSVLGYYTHDTVSMEKLINKHAFFEVFFNKKSSCYSKPSFKPLNIQWAIDIKNQIPN